MGESAYLKTSCLKCGGHVDFPEELENSTVPCPHCGKDLFLYRSTHAVGTSVPSKSPTMPLSSSTSKSKKQSHKALWASAAFAFLIVAIFEFHSLLSPLMDASSGSTDISPFRVAVCVVCGVLFFVCVFAAGGGSYQALIPTNQTAKEYVTQPSQKANVQANAQPAGRKTTWFARACGFVFKAIILLVVLLVVERVFFPSMYFSFKADVVGAISNQPYRLAIDNYLRAHANDPNSVEIVSLGSPVGYSDGTRHISCTFRAKNALGALVLDTVVVKVNTDNQVVGLENQGGQ